jgi:hypothetical protein
MASFLRRLLGKTPSSPGGAHVGGGVAGGASGAAPLIEEAFAALRAAESRLAKYEQTLARETRAWEAAAARRRGDVAAARREA